MDRSQSIRLERARQQYEHLLIHAGQMVLDNDKFLSPSTGILQSSYQKQDAHDSYRSKSDNDNNNSINRYSHNSNRNNNTDHSYLIDSSSSLYPPQPPILSQYIKSSSDYSNQPLDKSNTHTFAQSITSTPYYNSTHSNNKNNSSQLNHHKNNSISSYTHIHSPSYLNEQLNSQYGNNINYNNHNHISTNKTLPPMSSSDKDEVIISLQDQIVKLNHELNSTIEKANKTINSDHELVEKLKEEYAGAEDELYHKNIALTNAIENLTKNSEIMKSEIKMEREHLKKALHYIDRLKRRTKNILDYSNPKILSKQIDSANNDFLNHSPSVSSKRPSLNKSNTINNISKSPLIVNKTKKIINK